LAQAAAIGARFAVKVVFMQETIRRLVARQNLERTEAAELMCALMDGQASPAQVGGLLVALRMKGETLDEVTGFAQAMRSRLIAVTPKRRPLLDTCGTGGSATKVFNVSTAAAFVAASAGIAVAKHGNRAVSGVCGSADVLEALGIRIDLSPDQVAGCIDEVGLGFLFAPALHPALRHVGGPRRELGVRTLFNLLGPLANPARAQWQVMGVYDSSLCDLAARALRELGSDRAIVVHADIGMGEISTVGATHVCELREGEVRSYRLTRSDLGLSGHEPDPVDFAPASTPAVNAGLVIAALEPDPRDAAVAARRELIAVNAGAAFRVAGMAGDWVEAVAMAQEQIASGAPLELIGRLARLSHGFEAPEEV
jgi:anthranilate phosphoribosyltransferase